MFEADQERTFRTFVGQLSAWWPIESHPNGRRAPDVRVEECLGGRVYQVDGGGREHDRGRVTAWDPPRSVSFTWEAVPGPEFTEVDLAFQRLGPALTRVVVVHRGWEFLSTALLDRYTTHEGGWLAVLRNFAAMFEVEGPPADDPTPGR